jgi:hypothetical protein
MEALEAQFDATEHGVEPQPSKEGPWLKGYFSRYLGKQRSNDWFVSGWKFDPRGYFTGFTGSFIAIAVMVEKESFFFLFWF